MSREAIGSLCPRCGRRLTTYPAMSRTDNKTNICSPCGNAEALEDFSGALLPQESWSPREPSELDEEAEHDCLHEHFDLPRELNGAIVVECLDCGDFVNYERD